MNRLNSVNPVNSVQPVAQPVSEASRVAQATNNLVKLVDPGTMVLVALTHATYADQTCLDSEQVQRHSGTVSQVGTSIGSNEQASSDTSTFSLETGLGKVERNQRILSMHGMTSVLDGIITVNHFGVVYVLRQMGTSKYWEFDATKLLGGDLIHSSCLEDTGDQFISIEGDHEFYANTLNKYYSIAVLAMASMEAKAS